MTQQIKYEEIEHISLKDTAKLIREELKKFFPKIKFSVVGKSYSGGSSINIVWTDGICENRVKEAIGKYEGATFDGSIDLKTYIKGELNGKKVHFGTDYIFCRRELSIEVVKRLSGELSLKYNISLNGEPDQNFDLFGEYCNTSQLIHREYYDKDIIEEKKEAN